MQLSLTAGLTPSHDFFLQTFSSSFITLCDTSLREMAVAYRGERHGIATHYGIMANGIRVGSGAIAHQPTATDKRSLILKRDFWSHGKAHW